MPDAADSSLRIALAVAVRHFDDASTTEAERDEILRAATKHLGSREAEEASRALFHREQARAHQMVMRALLDGIGKPPEGKN